MKIPELNEGERYAGIVIRSITGKPTHHLILLPHKPSEPLNWYEAMEWAASVGAELPTRQEATLLHANLKPAFEPTWYWTGEQYAGTASNASNAWNQDFDDGSQYYYGKGYKGSARAIRRVHVTEN